MNKVSHQNIINAMLKKLSKNNAKNRTISAFTKEAIKIIGSNYQVAKRLKQLKASITDKPTLSKTKKTIIQNKKDDKLVPYLSKVKSLNGFQDNKTTLAKVLKALGKNASVRDLPIQYKKKGMIEIHVNQNQTKQQIEALGNKISNIFKNDKVNGMLSIALKYDKGYRSGYFTNFGTPIELYSPDMYDDDHHHYVDHQDRFNKYSIFISESKLTQVGDDKYNDCFYKCLKFVLNDKLTWKSPEEFKHYLKVPRFMKVDLAFIPQVEKKLNMPINTTGDYVYNSSIKSLKSINLKVIDEHCTVDKQKHYKLEPLTVSGSEKKPIIYDPASFMAYDGIKEYKMSRKERDSHKFFKTPNILVTKRPNKLSLQEEYKEFIHDADLLKAETNNMINLYKSGYKSKNTALDLFDRFTKHIPNADHIHQSEAIAINKASQGAIIFSDDYQGPAYKYDVKSMYPSIMDSNMIFPIKEGEFMKLTKEQFTEMKNTFFKYGIYRVNINYNSQYRKLFRFSKHNYYTHIDLTRAKELNLDMNIVDDDQANFLYYSRDKCLTGHELFGTYVNLLFKLKQKKISRAKDILNVLWGALSQTDTKHVTVSDNEYLIDDDCEIHEIKPSIINDNEIVLKIKNNDKQYKTGFARIMPFLIAKGRYNISKIMEKYIDIVIRCHTDGIITSELPKDIKLGDDIGDLVYEGFNDNYFKTGNSYNKDDFKM